MQIGEKVKLVLQLTQNDYKVAADKLGISTSALTSRIRANNFDDRFLERIGQITDMKADDIRNIDEEKLRRALSSDTNIGTVVITHSVNITINGLDAEGINQITSIIESGAKINQPKESE